MVSNGEERQLQQERRKSLSLYGYCHKGATGQKKEKKKEERVVLMTVFPIQNSSLAERDFDQQSKVQNVHLLCPPQAEKHTVSMLLQHIFPPLIYILF